MSGLLVWATDVEVNETPAGSPGFVGFVFTFLLAVALVLLFLSLTKHLRIVDRRAKQLGLDDDEPQAAGGDARRGAATAAQATGPEDAPADAADDAPDAGDEAAGPDRSR